MDSPLLALWHECAGARSLPAAASRPAGPRPPRLSVRGFSAVRPFLPGGLECPAVRVLIVTAKRPFPPVGGGNLVVHHLADALLRRGAEVRVIALGTPAGVDAPYPVLGVAARPRSWWRVAHHLLLPPPAALARFRLPALARAVVEASESFRPDVVHVEQLHLGWLAARRPGRVPVVLREQNVESQVLRRFAPLHRWPLRVLLAREARRTESWERRAWCEADAVAAISEPNAVEIRRVAPTARVTVLDAPFALEPSRPPATRLDGSPPVVCLGSFDWAPNRDGASWFLREVWPQVSRGLAGAVLHVAGPGSQSLPGGRADVRLHGPVPDAAAVHGGGAVSVIPVRAGSGVRLRILEAWALGVPTVTTTVGGEGLVGASGDGALVADEPHSFAAAIAALTRDAVLRARLVSAGRGKLGRHAPDVVADQALRLYESLASGGGGRA